MSYVFDQVFSSSPSSGHSPCVTVTAPSSSVAAEDIFFPVRTLLEGVMGGTAHGTVLAYGQTAAGKTYTVAELIRYLSQELMRGGDGRHSRILTVQYSQIYNDRTYDLLAQNKLCSSPSNSTSLSAQTVTSEEELLKCYHHGNQTRSTAATAMNEASSRSHAILTLTLNCNGRKLFLVDLAGSERVKKSFATGNTFKEATEINSSLLVLSRVLRAKITPGNTHVPYRDSALTMALEDMFESRNHRAVLFACISPCQESVAESIQTLRFASNATYVQEPSTSSSTTHKGISATQEDTTEGRDWIQLRRAAEATKGLFGSFGECLLPATEGFPRLHCIGRDASNDSYSDCGSDGCGDGDGDSESVLLLHYYGGACFEKGAAMWSEAIQKFPPHLRVIALSFSGHGLSEGRPPRSSPEAECFLEPGGAVAQVQRVMDYFGVKEAHVVGFDYGGGVAMQMALSVPHRVLSLCAWNPSYRISSLSQCQESCSLSSSSSLSLNKKRHPQKQQKNQQWMVQKMSLIVTSSVWMPEKKIYSLQSFMNTKASKCRRECDVWKKIFKFLQQ